jgi:hypothetical protein
MMLITKAITANKNQTTSIAASKQKDIRQ